MSADGPVSAGIPVSVGGPGSGAPPEGTPGAPRRGHRARWIAGIALVVVAAVLVVLATRPSYQASEAVSPLVGHQAPAITGTTVTGQPFDLAAYRGRWVVLNFFASWCVPCRQEEPNLVTFAFDHRQPGQAALVGVVFEDTASAARRWQAQQGATWPTLTDPKTDIALAYGVTSPPETYLISPTGMVAAHIYGAIPSAGWLDQQLARAQRAYG